MYYKKINSADLWNKIRLLRELIKNKKNFKKRSCWACKRDLNIFDFLSDNVEFSATYIFYLWQNSILEFHCCECFKFLKIEEIKLIERELKTRNCPNCNAVIDIYKFVKIHDYLKIKELKEFWLNLNAQVFCDRLCQRKYYKKLHESRLKHKE